MKQIFCSTIYLLFINFCSAQLAESIHQSFEIDEINSITINLKGDIDVQTWAGNTILTETKVKLYDASPGILNYFVKLGRYEIENKISSTNVYLSSKDIVRRPIRTKNGECFEEVRVQVFLPDDFEAATETVWTRKKEATVIPTTEKQDSLRQKESLEKPKKDTTQHQINHQ